MSWSVSFDGIPLSTWGLEQTAPAEIGPPEPRLYQVAVPGFEDKRTGTMLDLTDDFFGRIPYENRLITINCVCRRPRSQWPDLRSSLASEIHGQLKKIVFDDDQSHYWYGRCYLERWNADGRLAYPVITIEAAPFKWDADATTIVHSVTARTNNVILPGKNVSKQEWNTDLRYGSQKLPTMDFSPFSMINCHFTAARDTVTIQIIDGNGFVYNTTWLREGTDEMTASFLVPNLEAAGVDIKNIWRILVSMGANAVVVGIIFGTTVKISSGVRTADLTADIPNGVQYVRCGTDVLDVTGGFNDLSALQLSPGDNELVFYSDSNFPTSGEITINYRKGWL